jgi:uncharacterized protein YegL
MTNQMSGQSFGGNDLNDLFDEPQSVDQSLQPVVTNLNATTMAHGMSPEDLVTEEVFIVVEITDRTGSMSSSQQTVIDAYNGHLAALAGSKAADSILWQHWLFDTSLTLLHGPVPVANAIRLDTKNYDPDGQTALHDAVLSAFDFIERYVHTLQSKGIRARVVINAVTDGQDNASRHTAQQVKDRADALVREEIYTLNLVAFGVDGQRIADAMGFQNVLTANSSEHDIRIAYGTMSASMIRASQTVIGADQSASFFS